MCEIILYERLSMIVQVPKRKKGTEREIERETKKRNGEEESREAKHQAEEERRTNKGGAPILTISLCSVFIFLSHSVENPEAKSSSPNAR